MLDYYATGPDLLVLMSYPICGFRMYVSEDDWGPEIKLFWVLTLKLQVVVKGTSLLLVVVVRWLGMMSRQKDKTRLRKYGSFCNSTNTSLH